MNTPWISPSLLSRVQEFDLGGFATSFRETEVREETFPDGRVVREVRITEVGGVLDSLSSPTSGIENLQALKDPIETLRGALPPAAWMTGIIDIEGDLGGFVERLGGLGFPFPDAAPSFRTLFKAASPGRSLASLGFVPVLLPPAEGLIRTLGTISGVRAVFDGDLQVSHPPPVVVASKEDLWDGHDQVLGRDESGKYPSWYDPAKAGDGVRIAVLDTGIAEEHRAFGGGKILAKADFTGDGPGDRNGHGTYCAGIAAAGPYGGGRFHGIAPSASLLDGKVLGDKGSGFHSWILSGMSWALDQEADVVSMSIGGPGRANGKDAISVAVDRLVKRGVFVSVSAGNSGPEKRSITPPGDATLGMCSGAVDRKRFLAAFSSRGPTESEANSDKPDLCAPGVAVVGPRAPESGRQGGAESDDVILMSGTSMAAPGVAGAAAVLISMKGISDPGEIAERFRASAEELHGPPGIGRHDGGSGTISLAKAMAGDLLAPIEETLAGVIMALALVMLLAFWLGGEPDTGREMDPAVLAAQGIPVDSLEPLIPSWGPRDESPETPLSHGQKSPGGEEQWAAAPVPFEPQPLDGASTRKSCYTIEPFRRQIVLTVYRGMTLWDLEQHFGVSPAQLRAVNPRLRTEPLMAGKQYLIPFGGLEPVFHQVSQGETLWGMVEAYGVPNHYSIRTWNCLPNNTIRPGDELLLFLDR